MWQRGGATRAIPIFAGIVMAIGTGRAEAAGAVCFEPVNSVALPAISQVAAALQAKGCSPGDVFVAVIPKQIKAGPSLVAATFCDYRGAITMLAPESSDNTELSCVLTEPRSPRTSR